MKLEEIKNNLIELFAKLNYKKETTDIFVDFIKSYDDKDEQKFAAAMTSALLLMMRLEQLEVKGKAFDSLNENNENFNMGLVGLKKEFERIEKGLEPETPMQSAE